MPECGVNNLLAGGGWAEGNASEKQLADDSRQ